MSSIFCQVSKYIMLFLFALYTYDCFAVLMKHNQKEEKQDKIFRHQNIVWIRLHLDAYLVIFDQSQDLRCVFLYIAELVFFIVIKTSYNLLYEKSSRLLVNNMCILMIIGFIMLTRLSFDKAAKQFAVSLFATVICMLIPLAIEKIKFVRNMTWVYAVVGLIALGYVYLTAATSYGAKLSITIAGYSLQLSEFVKIIFVFFVAGMFIKATDLKTVMITTAIAALHVIILVLSKDLGGALIFFIVYIVMLYVATHKLYYFVAGLLAGSLGAVVAYFLFSHVQTRVIAWKDPLSVIDDEGYQICQSLFAIGSGGWFGTGLYQGMPDKIPVVEQDFIFSAISEEMGGLFSICIILVCLSCLLMFLNIAMQMKDMFYKLVALGLGTVYGFQIFLTIGGVIKFIPSTGVTLPLVSYGGSSLLSTLIIFAIIQGFYLRRENEVYADALEEEK